MAKIKGIRIFRGESTTDVLADHCHYMYLSHIEVSADTESERRSVIVPGISYKLDKDKAPLPIIEMDIFVPMTSVVQISFE